MYGDLKSLNKSHKGGLKNPLARAQGLGSAHAGVHHWLIQRITAIAAIPLTIWLAWSIIGLVHADQPAVAAWLAKPWNAILMILTIITYAWHAALGCQVIIEDYLHTEWFRIAKLLGMRFVLSALAVASVFAVLKVAL
jgi:succinate dehydrogenase / fumarate reductase membrane anchor subunit